MSADKGQPSSKNAWLKEPLGFRNVMFGWTLQEVGNAIGTSKCDPDSCFAEIQIGDADVNVIYLFDKGKLADVGLSFSPDNYELLKQAFTEKMDLQ